MAKNSMSRRMWERSSSVVGAVAATAGAAGETGTGAGRGGPIAWQEPNAQSIEAHANLHRGGGEIYAGLTQTAPSARDRGAGLGGDVVRYAKKLGQHGGKLGAAARRPPHLVATRLGDEFRIPGGGVESG